MSSASAAPAPVSVGNCEDSIVMSTLQTINELRLEEHFIDIEIEVCEVLMHFSILFNAGLTREEIRGTQSCARSQLPQLEESSH